MSNDTMSSTRTMEPRLFDDNKMLTPHIDDYSRAAHLSLDRILRLWNEIELPKEERQHELSDISSAVKHIWTAAVGKAEKKKEEVQQEIDKSVQDIYIIKEELGEAPKEIQQQGIEGLLKLEQIVGCSLRARYMAVQEILQKWKRQRTQREEDFKALQSQINRLKIRFGDVVIAPSLSPRKSDISLGNLQKLKRELEECKSEKLKRERSLAALLSKLRGVCLQIGENDIDVAAMAHPSLRFYREALPDQFSLIRPSFSNQPGLQRNVRPDDIELDLSDETFTNLESKIGDMFDLKATREKQTTEVAEILKSLWRALDVPEDDLERGIHIRALEGPTRLHAQSIEKCKAEVRRLEKAKAQELWELIDQKRSELELLCEETKLPMPRLCPLLSISNVEDDDGAPVGKISDALSKLSKMITETRSLAEKREPIIARIIEIERSRSEVNWLSEYEKDGDRYKGRDSTKKLNRALRAGRMRDKLPDMIKTLKKSIMQWEQDERCPFVYDCQDYSVVLENLLIELSCRHEPPRNPRRATSRGRAPSRTSYTPPPPHAVSPTPSSLDVPDDPRFGPSHLPHCPGSGSQNSSQNQKGGLSPTLNIATSDTLRHRPDGEGCHVGTSHVFGRSRCLHGTNNSLIRPSQSLVAGRSNESSKSTTPTEYDLYSPMQQSTGVVMYNGLYRTSPMTDARGLNLARRSTMEMQNDHPFAADWHSKLQRPRTETRLLSKQSSLEDTGRRSDLHGSSSAADTRSTSSSHRSLALERTDGRPT